MVGNGDMVGNDDLNFVTPLSQMVLNLYLACCLFKIIGITHIPHCYGSLVTMAAIMLCK